MSIKLMERVWAVEGLRATERLLLLCLADFADEDHGHCWPSRETLRRKLHLADKGSVSRLLGALEAKHLIRRANYHSDTGQQTTNDYFLDGLLEGKGVTANAGEQGGGEPATPPEQGGSEPAKGGGLASQGGGSEPATPRGSEPATQIRQRDPSTDPSENHQPVCSPAQRPPRTPAFIKAHNRFGHLNSAYLRYLGLGSVHRQTREQVALVLKDRGEDIPTEEAPCL